MVSCTIFSDFEQKKVQSIPVLEDVSSKEAASFLPIQKLKTKNLPLDLPFYDQEVWDFFRENDIPFCDSCNFSTWENIYPSYAFAYGAYVYLPYADFSQESSLFYEAFHRDSLAMVFKKTQQQPLYFENQGYFVYTDQTQGRIYFSFQKYKIDAQGEVFSTQGEVFFPLKAIQTLLQPLLLQEVLLVKFPWDEKENNKN